MDVAELTQESLDQLESEVSELKKFKDESAPKLEQYTKAQEDLTSLKAEFEKQAPNWQKTRDKMSRLESIVKSKGVETDDEGNIRSGGQQLTTEDVTKAAQAAARTELLGDRLEEILSEYDDSSKELVRHYYSKLTNGEEVNIKNIRKFVGEAESAARGGGAKVVRVISGQGPRSADESTLTDERAEDLGSRMGLGFATQPKKK